MEKKKTILPKHLWYIFHKLKSRYQIYSSEGDNGWVFHLPSIPHTLVVYLGLFCSLCWFSIQWPVFSLRTLYAPFIVVFSSCKNLCLRLFLHNAGTDCLYLWKLVLSNLLSYLSKVVFLLISLTYIKIYLFLEEDQKLFLMLFLLNHQSFYFPLCLYVLDNILIWYVPQESWFVWSCLLF